MSATASHLGTRTDRRADGRHLRHDPVLFRHTMAFTAGSFPAHATRRLLHDASAHRRRTADTDPAGAAGR